jgi:hypothetical protein
MVLQAGDAHHNFQPFFYRFSAANHFRESKSFISKNTPNQPQSVFAVVRPTSSNGEGRIIGLDDTPLEAAIPGFGISQGSQHFYRYAPAANELGRAYTVNTSNILGWRVDSGKLNQRLNGRESNASSVGNATLYAPYIIVGYGSYGDGKGAFPGDIQEIIWYNQYLSAKDTQKVENYLALKYGITLSSNNPDAYLASDGTTKMRDDLLAGSYKNDIAGIGRDDTSALNQKQSISVQKDMLTIGLGSIASSNQTNPHTFSQDLSFLTRANNGNSIKNWSGTNVPATFSALPRIWQLQLVGNGISSIALRASSLPADKGRVFALLDDDGNFSNGGTKKIKLTNNNGDWEGIVNAQDIQPYLTFATRDPDIVSPLIILNGASPLLLYQGMTYGEQGANWTDNYDGTGAVNAASSGQVDTTLPGSYLLQYRYTDEEGNQSPIVERTVVVLPAPSLPTCTATPSITSGTVQIVCSQIASGDTLTLPPLTCTPTPSLGGDVVCNGTLSNSNPTVIVANPAGTVSGTVNVVVDNIAPICSVSYSTLGATNQNVIANLTGCSETVTVKNNAGLADYTFT